MTTESNKEAARQFVEEVWNEKNLDVVDELYHPDYTGHWYAIGGDDVDREGMKEFVRGIHHGFPDFEMNIEFIHGADDLVTVGFTGLGTHENEWMGIPPEETPTRPDRPVPGHITSRFEDGKIVEGWSTWDALSLMQGLGVLPEDLGALAPAADD